MSSQSPPQASAPTIEDRLQSAAPDLEGDPAERAARQQLRARMFEAPAEPETIGRYEIRGRLGHGGIGVVYDGWDPRLRREVAVKLLHDRGVDSSRLRREAQALARLSDPHVVEVFEVGTHDGDVFVAMARVEGATLRTWQKDRGIDEILAAYLQAARGLAAAHRVGVVHQDFKPDNAMMGTDGRVRLLDFGLANLVEARRAASSEATTHDGQAVAPTSDGGIRGTPGYMPVEQLAGRSVDARADQFAWCVALYEALYGHRPFEGDTPAEYVGAVVDGRIRDAPAGSPVPRHVRAVLQRGLARDRDDRWPTMEALTDALEHARRRRWVWPLLATGAIVTAAALVAYPRPKVDLLACAHAGESIDAVWSTDTRAALLQQRGAADRVAAVDDAVAQWRQHAVGSCLAPATNGVDQLCLADVRAGIEARVITLRRDDATTVAGPLLDFTTCMDARRRGAVPTIGTGHDAEAIIAIRDAIATTVARGRAGDFAGAAETIAPAVASARELRQPSLLAEALLLLAACEASTGDLEGAERDAKEAYGVAMAAGHDRLALRAATDLVVLVGHEQRRQVDGERWARAGEALAKVLGDDDLVRARFLVNRGLMRLDFGHQTAARQDLDAARQTYTSVLGADSTELIPILGNLAHLALDDGAFDDARALMDRAISLRSTHHPEHPDLAGMYVNRALVEIAAERWDDAQRDLDRALPYEADGVDPIGAATRRIAASALAYETGRLADARAEAEAALALAIDHAGEAHPTTQTARLRLAEVLLAQGQREAATTELHRITSTVTDSDGELQDVVAQAWLEIAGVHLADGRTASAAAAMAHVPSKVTDACMQAQIRAGEAEVEIAMGQPEVTVAALLQALRHADHCSALVRAEVETTTVRAMQHAGMPAERWRPLLARARARYEDRGGDWVAHAQRRQVPP